VLDRRSFFVSIEKAWHVEKYLLVMVGGAVGSLMRFVMTSAIMTRYAGRFPLGTFAVNVAGSFAIGVLMTIFAGRQLHQNWRLFLVVGLLGGYTTFSSFEYEAYLAGREGDFALAVLYIVLSVVCGLAALLVGVAVARKYT
jgi:CrcB protein